MKFLPKQTDKVERESEANGKVRESFHPLELDNNGKPVFKAGERVSVRNPSVGRDCVARLQELGDMGVAAALGSALYAMGYLW